MVVRRKLKLVRDKIVAIRTCEEGIEPNYQVLKDSKKWLKYARRKIVEEARELGRAKTREQVIEEVVDLQDIIKTFLKELGIGLLEVEKARMEKKKKKGEFNERIVMEVTPAVNKKQERRRKNETSDFLSCKTALAKLLLACDWKRFIKYAHDMPDKAALWDILESVDPKHLVDLFVGGSESGFIKKLFGYDAEKTIKVLNRLKNGNLDRVFSVISEEEAFLILRNTRNQIGGLYG